MMLWVVKPPKGLKQIGDDCCFSSILFLRCILLSQIPEDSLSALAVGGAVGALWREI